VRAIPHVMATIGKTSRIDATVALRFSARCRNYVGRAKISGVACYIERELNRWSSVHIADVAALYVLAIAKAPAGSFMYVESGEEALGEIVKTIAAWLSFGTAPSLSAEEAIATCGQNIAIFSLGSKSRVRGRASANFGWRPTHRSIIAWIANHLI
jgi:nucleoside-diphosphate-sugar epimerase